MSRGDQLYRQWSIIDQLSSGRKSRRQLAERCGVSLKTIARDIQALSIFPISEERDGIDVYYGLLPGGRAPSVRFQPMEVAALLLSEPTIAGALDGSPYADAVASALAKVELLQRADTYRALHRLPDVFQSSFAKPSVRADLQRQLLDAALSRQLVYMTYHTAERGQLTERTVEPFFLHLHPHGLHLIGYCLARQDFLYFNVNCIRSLQTLEQTFEPRERAFVLDEFLATVFDGHRGTPILDVRLRIRNPTAHWARDQFFHATQVIRELEDGVEIGFRSGAPDAIAARALSLGPDCEVLEPVYLRQMVAKKARDISALYESDEIVDNPGPDVSGVDATPSSAATRESRRT